MADLPDGFDPSVNNPFLARFQAAARQADQDAQQQADPTAGLPQGFDPSVNNPFLARFQSPAASSPSQSATPAATPAAGHAASTPPHFYDYPQFNNPDAGSDPGASLDARVAVGTAHTMADKAATLAKYYPDSGIDSTGNLYFRDAAGLHSYAGTGYKSWLGDLASATPDITQAIGTAGGTIAGAASGLLTAGTTSVPGAMAGAAVGSAIGREVPEWLIRHALGTVDTRGTGQWLGDIAKDSGTAMATEGALSGIRSALAAGGAYVRPMLAAPDAQATKAAADAFASSTGQDVPLSAMQVGSPLLQKELSAFKGSAASGATLDSAQKDFASALTSGAQTAASGALNGADAATLYPSVNGLVADAAGKTRDAYGQQIAETFGQIPGGTPIDVTAPQRGLLDAAATPGAGDISIRSPGVFDATGAHKFIGSHASEAKAIQALTDANAAHQSAQQGLDAATDATRAGAQSQLDAAAQARDNAAGALQSARDAVDGRAQVGVDSAQADWTAAKSALNQAAGVNTSASNASQLAGVTASDAQGRLDAMNLAMARNDGQRALIQLRIDARQAREALARASGSAPAPLADVGHFILPDTLDGGGRASAEPAAASAEPGAAAAAPVPDGEVPAAAQPVSRAKNAVTPATDTRQGALDGIVSRPADAQGSLDLRERKPFDDAVQDASAAAQPVSMAKNAVTPATDTRQGALDGIVSRPADAQGSLDLGEWKPFDDAVQDDGPNIPYGAYGDPATLENLGDADSGVFGATGFVPQTGRFGKPLSPFATVPKEPMRLSSYLRGMGGINDVGGDVRSSLGGVKGRPGLINRNGLSLDDATQRAWDAGYMPDFADRPAINDMIDALHGDLNQAPRYSHLDDALVSARESAQAKNAEISLLAQEHGLPISGLSQDDFYRMVAGRLHPDEGASVPRSLDDLAGEDSEWNAAVSGKPVAAPEATPGAEPDGPSLQDIADSFAKYRRGPKQDIDYSRLGTPDGMLTPEEQARVLGQEPPAPFGGPTAPYDPSPLRNLAAKAKSAIDDAAEESAAQAETLRTGQVADMVDPETLPGAASARVSHARALSAFQRADSALDDAVEQWRSGVSSNSSPLDKAAAADLKSATKAHADAESGVGKAQSALDNLSSPEMDAASRTLNAVGNRLGSYDPNGVFPSTGLAKAFFDSSAPLGDAGAGIMGRGVNRVMSHGQAFDVAADGSLTPRGVPMPFDDVIGKNGLKNNYWQNGLRVGSPEHQMVSGVRDGLDQDVIDGLDRVNPAYSDFFRRGNAVHSNYVGGDNSIRDMVDGAIDSGGHALPALDAVANKLSGGTAGSAATFSNYGKMLNYGGDNRSRDLAGTIISGKLAAVKNPSGFVGAWDKMAPEYRQAMADELGPGPGGLSDTMDALRHLSAKAKDFAADARTSNTPQGLDLNNLADQIAGGVSNLARNPLNWAIMAGHGIPAATLGPWTLPGTLAIHAMASAGKNRALKSMLSPEFTQYLLSTETPLQAAKRAFLPTTDGGAFGKASLLRRAAVEDLNSQQDQPNSNQRRHGAFGGQ